MSDVVYFSKMYQAILALTAIQRELNGVFVSSRATTYSYFKREYPSLQREKLNRRLKLCGGGHRAMLKARCIVVGSPYRKLLAPYPARKAMIFHGTYSDIGWGSLKSLAHFDHLFLNGPRMEKKILRYQRDDVFNYSQTGFIPFGSFPEKTARNRRAVLDSLGLDGSLKTIVYCPTSKKVGSWNQCAEALIKEVSGEYNLILRPHPRQMMNLRWYEKSSMRKLQALAKSRRNTFIDLVNVHYPDLLMAADLLISDANSATEESLFYDTPQLLTGLGNSSYENIEKCMIDLKKDQDDIDEDLKIFECGPVYAKEKYEDWREAADDALCRRGAFSGQRQLCFKHIFGQRDREAGKRVAQIIREKLL